MTNLAPCNARMVAIIVVFAGAHFPVAGADDLNPPEIPSSTAVAAAAPAASQASPVSNPTAFAISSNNQGSSASLKASLDLPRWFTPGSLTASSASLNVSTPVAKGSAPTTFATLGGFTNATTATAQYSLTLFPSLDRKKIIDLLMQCAAAADSLRGTSQGAGGGTCPDLSQYKPENDAQKAAWLKWKSEYDALKAQVKDPAQATPQAWFLGFNVTGTDDAHTYYGAKSLAKAQFTDVPITAGPFATYVFQGWLTAATVQFQYATTETDNPSQTLCPAGLAPVACVVGSIGRPKKTTQDTFSLEVRRSQGLFGHQLGFAPKVSYDANSGIYAFSLPVFLFGCGKLLNGGIQYDWSSDVHRSTVGAFVTVPFTVFNGLSSGASTCPSGK